MKILACIVLLLFAPFAGATRVVVDEIGRHVEVPDHPHRIICLIPSVADDVFSLGSGADVVAVSEYTDYPAEAASKPKIGPPMNPSLEKIVALHPDLILGTAEMNRTPALEGMSRRGVPIFFVDPHGIAGIYRAISSIGHVLNRDREAANLVADLHAREQRTRARAQGKVPVRIFLPVWYDPITTIGRRAFITELIEAAGASSITSDIAQEWPQVSLESVVARHPEALVLIRGSQISPEMLSSRPGWAQLPAIQKHHIYFVDEHIQLPGPSAIHAMEALSKEFYP